MKKLFLTLILVLFVIPSQNLVIIRIGEAPDSDNLVPINFHNEIWSYLNDILF